MHDLLLINKHMSAMTTSHFHTSPIQTADRDPYRQVIEEKMEIIFTSDRLTYSMAQQGSIRHRDGMTAEVDCGTVRAYDDVPELQSSDRVVRLAARDALAQVLVSKIQLLVMTQYMGGEYAGNVDVINRGSKDHQVSFTLVFKQRNDEAKQELRCCPMLGLASVDCGKLTDRSTSRPETCVHARIKSLKKKESCRSMRKNWDSMLACLKEIGISTVIAPVAVIVTDLFMLLLNWIFGRTVAIIGCAVLTLAATVVFVVMFAGALKKLSESGEMDGDDFEFFGVPCGALCGAGWFTCYLIPNDLNESVGAFEMFVLPAHIGFGLSVVCVLVMLTIVLVQKRRA